MEHVQFIFGKLFDDAHPGPQPAHIIGNIIVTCRYTISLLSGGLAKWLELVVPTTKQDFENFMGSNCPVAPW